MRLKLKSNDDGKEAKSIGDCGEDCSSCTHSIFDSIGNDLVHAMHDVTVIGCKDLRFEV